MIFFLQRGHPARCSIHVFTQGFCFALPLVCDRNLFGDHILRISLRLLEVRVQPLQLAQE